MPGTLLKAVDTRHRHGGSEFVAVFDSGTGTPQPFRPGWPSCFIWSLRLPLRYRLRSGLSFIRDRWARGVRKTDNILWFLWIGEARPDVDRTAATTFRRRDADSASESEDRVLWDG